MTEDSEKTYAIPPVTEPWGIFTDILLRPRRFFDNATEAHLVEGAKVGIISGVLGFFLGVMTNIGLNWLTSDGAPIDASSVWGIPFSVAAIAGFLAAEFFVTVALVRLMRGKGSLRNEILVFDCSLAPTILWAIPFLGVVVAPIYQMVIFGRGLATADSVSAARAYAAAIIGLLVTFFLFVAVLIAVAVSGGM